MHQSVLILIPFAIIAKGRAWNKKTILFILIAIAAVMFIGKFTNFLDTVLSDTQYKNVVSDWKQFEDDGTNPIESVSICGSNNFILYWTKNYMDRG